MISIVIKVTAGAAVARAERPSGERRCEDDQVRIAALAGGIGGARFLRGVLAAEPAARLTVIGNTGDDITLLGLRVCPDLDTLMYTLGGGIDEAQGWGRADETWSARRELAAYDFGPEWFGLGDQDLATHLVRTQLLDAGYPLSQVTRALCDRWQPGVELLPMSDDRVETHIVVEDADGGRRALHFQEWWVRLHAEPPVKEVIAVGVEDAKPGPGVLEAIAAADVVLFPPSNPVVSIGTILAVPGIADAVRTTAAPVVGLSPIVGGAPVRGMADKLLPALGVATTAAAVGRHYGARNHGGLLDGWLVHVDDDADVPGVRTRAVPLMMTDLPATTAMARAALDLAAEVRR